MRIEQFILEQRNVVSSFKCIDDYGEWDFDSIFMRAVRLEMSLKDKGLGHLDRVAVVCDNGSAFIVAILGILMAGGIVVPIDPQEPNSAIVSLIDKVSAKIVCISGARPEKKFSDLSNNNYSILSEKAGDWDSEININAKEMYDKQNNNDDEAAFILFSSGTTGVPKGVVLSHKAILSNIQSIREYMKATSFDIFYITKTMVHSSTLTGEILVSLIEGATIIALNPVVPPRIILRRIRDYKPTIMCVNPTILRLFLKANTYTYDISSIKLLYVSGAVSDEKLLNSAEKLFLNAKVLNVYGLAEAGPRVTAQRQEEKAKYGSVGKAIKGVKVFIKNDKNELCKVDEVGNVFVETVSLMTEYWNDKIETEKKLNGNVLKTGDLGYFDADGELFILGRADDMIIRAAHKIDPNRIENIIRDLPRISNCIVFGVPDELNGNKVVCAYVREDSETGIDVKDIVQHCSKALSPYEIPQEIYEWDELPKTANGKLSRRLAVKYYETTIENGNLK